uniref:Tripartite motif-containing protein 16-like n=1 Tax=Oryzias latipes TaxID=8090 RepID=A0A3P9JMU7_ORYLA
MAQKGVDLDQETFCCSICQDLLKDPVTIPCGHSYCMKCIQEFWGEKEKIPSCPQCRKTFIQRPVLVKNFMLAALVDQSCLICPASYCEKHLQPHLDMFCRTDQKSICYLCPVDEHRGHNTVSAAAERTERQRELEESQQQIQQRIQDREKEVKLLQQEVEAINHSADQTVKDSEKIFTEMICLIQKRSCDVKQQIRSQQQTEVSRVKDLQEELEQEITELKRRDAQLKQLSLTEDHSQYFEDVTAAVSELRDKLQDILREEWTNISLTVTHVDVLLPEPEPEPKSRADFLKYSCQITLDPNTANRRLLLSEENRKMTGMKKPQSYSDHPDRFTDSIQVLSRESLTGRCYWEVERKGNFVRVAVTYNNISRSGDESRFGLNNKSWSLDCSPNSFSFYHNNIKTSISARVSSRVGVYLDHRAGVLSFYSVSESMTLLHRVQTTFTQPLHAGLRWDYVGATAEFCKLVNSTSDAKLSLDYCWE